MQCRPPGSSGGHCARLLREPVRSYRGMVSTTLSHGRKMFTTSCPLYKRSDRCGGRTLGQGNGEVRGARTASTVGLAEFRLARSSRRPTFPRAIRKSVSDKDSRADHRGQSVSTVVRGGAVGRFDIGPSAETGGRLTRRSRRGRASVRCDARSRPRMETTEPAAPCGSPTACSTEVPSTARTRGCRAQSKRAHEAERDLSQI